MSCKSTSELSACLSIRYSRNASQVLSESWKRGFGLYPLVVCLLIVLRGVTFLTVSPCRSVCFVDPAEGLCCRWARAGYRRRWRRRRQTPRWRPRCRRARGGRQPTGVGSRVRQSPTAPMRGTPRWPPRAAATWSCAACSSLTRCGQTCQASSCCWLSHLQTHACRLEEKDSPPGAADPLDAMLQAVCVGSQESARSASMQGLH